MYSNVDAAFATIIGPGLARANRFAVQFSFPGFGSLSSLQNLVEAIEIPNLALSTADYQLNANPLIKVPYARTPAQTITITFRESMRCEILNAFQTWQGAAIPSNSGDYFAKYPEELWGEIIFIAFNTAGPPGPLPTYTVKLLAAMPTTIEPVQYSYDDRDSYVKQTITFTYYDVEYNSSPKQQGLVQDL